MESEKEILLGQNKTVQSEKLFLRSKTNESFCLKNDESPPRYERILEVDEEAELKQILTDKAKFLEKENWFRALVFGPSQSGKSTLINRMFGGEMANTGKNGKPCTEDLVIYKNEQSKLEIIDTRGLVREKNRKTISQLKKSQPNIIWLVCNYQSSIETVEFDLLNLKPNIPVVVVLNKVDKLTQDVKNFDDDISKLPNEIQKMEKLINVRAQLLEKMDKYPNIKKIVVSRLDDPDDKDFLPIGIEAIFEATCELLDVAVLGDFARNVEGFKHKRIAGSVAIILSFTTLAASAAYIPVPIVDSIAITTIQIGMILSLFKTWGVVGKNLKSFAIAFLKGFCSGMVGFGIGYGLSMLVGMGMKFVPGVGTVVGGVIDSTIAASFTLVMGVSVTLYLCLNVCSAVSKMTADDLQKKVKEFMKNDDVGTFIKNLLGKSKEDIIDAFENIASTQKSTSTLSS